MSFLDHTSWNPRRLLQPDGKLPAGTDLSLLRYQRLAVGAIIFGLFSLSRFWQDLVNKYVPEPYLDEFFHIPQAQKYCEANFEWDPKITTPPGLYIVSAVVAKIILRFGVCTAGGLRMTNVFTLIVILFAALDIRGSIEQSQRTAAEKGKEGSARSISAYSIHTAVNICLFPPMFFFSGLYYTDVLSTCMVLLAYKSFLKHAGKPRSIVDVIDIILLGIWALFMRQTNIFWVAIFLAALEWVRTCNTMDSKPFSRLASSESCFQWTQEMLLFYARRNIHDLPLWEASIIDFAVCIVSIGLSAACNLPRLVARVWPYILLLVVFGAFVVWNGGVVLGDKDAHVATIHLAQMLYIWPFMAFFSLPLIYPYALAIVADSLEICGLRRSSPRTSSSPPSLTLISFGWIFAGIAAAIVVAHFNTIIHPYTLADNRHYVFYAFRYTIRRHALVKYMLAPVYVLSALLIYRCLAGVGVSKVKLSPATEALLKQFKRPWTWISPTLTQETNTTSFFLIWLLVSSLSLITAPLVEPRYFLIPWIIWRLHVPGIASSSSAIRSPPRTWYGRIKYWVHEGHDHRLWLETLWYLAISAVTGYVFLFKGFEWPSEPGKVQRFMW